MASYIERVILCGIDSLGFFFIFKISGLLRGNNRAQAIQFYLECRIFFFFVFYFCMVKSFFCIVFQIAERVQR